MADAVGGEDDKVRTSDEPGEKGRALCGVVVEEFDPDPGGRLPQRLGLAGPPADVEHCAWDRRIAHRYPSRWVLMADHRLRDRDLAPKPVYLIFEVRCPSPLGGEIRFQGSPAVFSGADAILLDGEASAKIGNQTFRLVCRCG